MGNTVILNNIHFDTVYHVFSSISHTYDKV